MVMSKESQNSKKGRMATARPFAAAIVKKAAALTPLYQVIVRWDANEKTYAGRCVELANAVGFGDTEAECIAEVRGNINALISFMIESGETPPLASDPERPVQVNVRYADYEKAAAQVLADAAGISLSEHIRLSSLRSV